MAEGKKYIFCKKSPKKFWQFGKKRYLCIRI